MKIAPRNVAQGALLAAVLAIFWLACVATLRLHEILVGLGAVILSAAFSIFVVTTLPLTFRPTLRQIVQIWRLPWNIAVDLLQIVLVLLCDFAGKPAPSLFRAAPWAPTGSNGRELAARVLAISCTTVSPNMVVIGIDCRNRRIFFHQIRRTPVPAMTRNLGAGGSQ